MIDGWKLLERISLRKYIHCVAVLVLLVAILAISGSGLAYASGGEIPNNEEPPDYSHLWFAAMYIMVMYIAAGNSKALGVSIVTAIGISSSYPDAEKAAFIVLMYVPAVLYASFRD